jgi:hypothetical protein
MKENPSPLTVLYHNLLSLQELDAMREGILDEDELPEPPGAVGRWAAEFCGASERFRAADARAEAGLQRAFTPNTPLPAAREAARAYIEAVTDAREVYRLDLRPAAELARGEAADMVGALHARLDTVLERSLASLATARTEVERLPTVGALAGRLVEIEVTEESDPATLAFYETYEALPLGAMVAIVDAGPCGEFAPTEFYERSQT